MQMSKDAKTSRRAYIIVFRQMTMVKACYLLYPYIIVGTSCMVYDDIMWARTRERRISNETTFFQC